MLKLTKVIIIKRQQHEINNDLLQSIWHQDPSRVKELLDEGAEVMANVNGIAPIFAALQNSNSAMNIEISKTILENAKFDATVKDIGGQTLLITFINSFAWGATLTEDKTFIIKKLLSAGADINGTQQHSPLIQAISKNNIELFKLLIDLGADIHHTTSNDTPLLRAISSSFAEVIQILLDKGAEVNPEINAYHTPLSAAVSNGDISLVKALLARGAEVNPLHTQNTPLTEAIHFNNAELINMFLELGAEVNPVNTQLSSTPLTAAIRVNNLELIKKLITEHKADLNPGNLFTQPFQQAMWSNNLDLVNLLFENGTINQATILKCILDSGPESIQNFLFSKVTDINAPIVKIHLPPIGGQPSIESEVTLLEAAINRHNPSLIEKLLRSGAQVEGKHFAMAQQINNITVIQTLIEFEINNTTDKQSLLPKAIKYKHDIADNLLSEGIKVDFDSIMSDLSIAISCGNTQIINILLKHKVQIDWNTAVDDKGNNLLLLLAKHPSNWNLVKEFIILKDINGHPIFQINFENTAGQKLIDIFKAKMVTEGETIHMPMINLLRECGSVEPHNPVVPNNIKLNTLDVHTLPNESIIRDMQSSLHKKHLVEPGSTEGYIEKIRQHIEDNADRVIEELISNNLLEGDQLPGQPNEITKDKALTNFLQLSNDISPHQEHNNDWNFLEELAYLCVEYEFLGKMDSFITIFGGLSSSCYWGWLVNLYAPIVNEKAVKFEPIINFKKIQSDVIELNKVADNVAKLLMNSGLSTEAIQNAALQFYDDMEKRINPKDYDISTEMILGYFFRYYVKMVNDAGKDPLEIYTEDANNFFQLSNGIAAIFEFYRDEEDCNLLYKLIKAAQDGVILGVENLISDTVLIEEVTATPAFDVNDNNTVNIGISNEVRSVNEDSPLSILATSELWPLLVGEVMISVYGQFPDQNQLKTLINALIHHQNGQPRAIDELKLFEIIKQDVAQLMFNQGFDETTINTDQLAFDFLAILSNDAAGFSCLFDQNPEMELMGHI